MKEEVNLCDVCKNKEFPSNTIASSQCPICGRDTCYAHNSDIKITLQIRAKDEYGKAKEEEATKSVMLCDFCRAEFIERQKPVIDKAMHSTLQQLRRGIKRIAPQRKGATDD